MGKFKKIISLTCIALISGFLLVACTDNSEPPEPNIKQILVSQAEVDKSVNWTFEQFVEHANSERKYSEIVRFEAANNYRQQLTIFIRNLNLDTGTMHHELVPTNRVVVQYEEDTIVRMNQNGVLYPRAVGHFYLDESLAIRVRDIYGRIREDLEPIGIRVVRNPVLVEQVILWTYGDNHTIRVNSERVIQSRVLPANASFWSTQFMIQSITVNGRTITNPTEREVYAYIRGTGTGSITAVRATTRMNLGDTITVIARNIHSGIYSEPLTLTVVA